MGCVNSELVNSKMKQALKQDNQTIIPKDNSKETQENPQQKKGEQILKIQSQEKNQQKQVQGDQKKITQKLNKVPKDYQIDLFILKELASIQKDLFASNIYLWIDSNINNSQIQNACLLLKKQGFDPVLYQSIEEAKNSVINNKNNSRFRVITSATMAEAICKSFKSNQKVVHIYIYGGQKSAGQALKKKERKIKFCTVSEEQFIQKIKQQSRYDNKFIDLPNFLKITNKNNDQDNTMINKSRYNLHGLLRFTNRVQAKEDFVKFVKYFYSIEDKAFKYEMEQFQNQYPVELDHKLALNWYTRPTFFYGFLNNMLRSTNNPLQTAYLRHPFESTFKAIKTLYDQAQKRSFKVYRGGFINNQQLKYMEQNVGQYIQMYGFVSTSEDYTVAESFRQRYNGNSLMTVLIQDQDRQAAIDYGYVSLVEYSDLPSEKQVLFNSLNVFKIVSYIRQDGINKITLKYGQLARMVKIGLDKVPQKQKNIIYNYKHQQEITSSIKNQGDVFKNCQMYNMEIKYRQKWIIQYKGQQNKVFVDQLSNLAYSHLKKSEYNKALQYYQRSLKICLNIFGEDSDRTANTLQGIGQSYILKRQYNKALQFLQKCLKIKTKIFGEDHKNTASTLQIIGNAYQNISESKKALQYFQRSLKIKMKIFGENNSNIANTLNNIGILYYSKLVEYNKALQYFQRALKINIKLLGENHSSTADNIQYIGIVYQAIADNNKALQNYQKSLKIYINILGENHYNTASLLNNIGNIYRQNSDYDKALQYYQRALQIFMNKLGENHITTADALSNIGILYQEKTEYNKALQYYQRALKIQMNILGDKDNNTGKTFYRIGVVYQEQKKYSTALQYLNKCHQIRVKIYEPNHEFIKQIQDHINRCKKNQSHDN